MKTLKILIVVIISASIIGCKNQGKNSSDKQNIIPKSGELVFGDKKVTAVYSINEKQIMKTFTELLEGSERGDVDAYLNCITDDFIYLGQGMKPISNRDSLRVFLDSFFSNYTFSFPNYTIHEIEIRDDLAIIRYSGIASISSKNNSSILELDRKYLDVVKKNKNGEWKFYLHSFNTNR